MLTCCNEHNEAAKIDLAEQNPAESIGPLKGLQGFFYSPGQIYSPSVNP
jgi:hypothetical protein